MALGQWPTSSLIMFPLTTQCMSLNTTITVFCVFRSYFVLSQTSFPWILSLLGRVFKFTLKLADRYCLSEMLLLIQDTLPPHLACHLHSILCCIKLVSHAVAEVCERPDLKCSPFHNVLRSGLVITNPHKDYRCHLADVPDTGPTWGPRHLDPVWMARNQRLVDKPET